MWASSGRDSSSLQMRASAPRRGTSSSPSSQQKSPRAFDTTSSTFWSKPTFCECFTSLTECLGWAAAKASTAAAVPSVDPLSEITSSLAAGSWSQTRAAVWRTCSRREYVGIQTLKITTVAPKQRCRTGSLSKKHAVALQETTGRRIEKPRHQSPQPISFRLRLGNHFLPQDLAFVKRL